MVRKGSAVQVRSGALGIGGETPILRSEEHTSELQSRQYLVCRLLLEKKIHHPFVSSIFVLRDGADPYFRPDSFSPAILFPAYVNVPVDDLIYPVPDSSY